MSTTDVFLVIIVQHLGTAIYTQNTCTQMLYHTTLQIMLKLSHILRAKVQRELVAIAKKIEVFALVNIHVLGVTQLCVHCTGCPRFVSRKP